MDRGAREKPRVWATTWRCRRASLPALTMVPLAWIGIAFLAEYDDHVRMRPQLPLWLGATLGLILAFLFLRRFVYWRWNSFTLESDGRVTVRNPLTPFMETQFAETRFFDPRTEAKDGRVVPMTMDVEVRSSPGTATRKLILTTSEGKGRGWRASYRCEAASIRALHALAADLGRATGIPTSTTPPIMISAHRLRALSPLERSYIPRDGPVDRVPEVFGILMAVYVLLWTFSLFFR